MRRGGEDLDRKEQLFDIVKNDGNDVKASQLVEEIVFLENKLVELKKYPFLSVNPNNPTQQKATPASKQYKEFLQQYTNCIKVLFALSGGESSEEESPLRQWAKSRKEGG